MKEPLLPVWRAGLTNVQVPHPTFGDLNHPVIGVWADLSWFNDCDGIDFSRAAGRINVVAEARAVGVNADQPHLLEVLFAFPIYADDEAEADTDAEATPEEAAGDAGAPVEPEDGWFKFRDVHEFLANTHPLDPAEDPDRSGTTSASSDDDDEDDEGQPVAWLYPFRVRLPAALLTVAAKMRDDDPELHVLLLDTPIPADPAAVVSKSTDVVAALRINPDLLVEPLSVAYHPVWAGASVDEANAPNVMRDLLWMTAAGTALGHEHALNRAAALGQWAAAVEPDTDFAGQDSGLPGQPTDRLLRLLDGTADEFLSMTRHFDPIVREGRTPMPRVHLLPAHLHERVVALVDAEALTALTRGEDFTNVAAEHGYEKAIPALVTAMATAATAASVEGWGGEATGTYTPTFILSHWGTPQGGDNQPWWTLRANHDLLLAHDTTVINDLLRVTPTARAALNPAPSLLLRRLLHTLTATIAGLEVDVDTLKVALRGMDVKPVNFEDMLHVATTLLTGVHEHRDPQRCAGCASVEALLASISDHERLVPATTALIPALSDLDAESHGLDVGEADWVEHRGRWLGYWLNETLDAS